MSRFSRALIVWYKQFKRELPWRNTKDPYVIWVSEIILQQTRVNQGLSYFNGFIDRFPTVKDLATASEDVVLKQWEGLGYYSRARNMHYTAKVITSELNGKFPDNYDDIIKLKGIGPYTAAAISSICYNENRTVVDGNVFRVITRIFGIDTPINTLKGKKEIESVAHELNDDNDSGTFNQALMEYGAIQCTPKAPKCNECIFNKECVALSNGLVDQLPVKEKKLVVKERFLNFIFMYDDHNQTIIEKRSKNDIWKGLYHFPLIESKSNISDTQVIENFGFKYDVFISSIKSYTHKLTHQKLNIQIVKLNIGTNNFSLFDRYKIVKVNDLENFAFPKPLERYINKL